MTKYVQSKDVFWNFLGDSIIAFSLAGEREFHHLNSTAATVFKSLETPKSRAEVLEALLAEFDVTSESASTDVQSTLEDMCRRNLIVEA